MPYTDDRHIVDYEPSKLKTFVLIIAIGLFGYSLINIGYCTSNNCRTSMEVLLMGWLAMMTGEAAISWLANPFLIIAWVKMTNNKKSAWIFGLIASVFSISFLNFQVIIENEAGYYFPITKIGLGYWLWLSSCLATFFGSLVIRLLKYRNS